MGQHHSSAAVAAQLELVQGISLSHGVVLEVLEIGFPLVAHDLAAGKAPDGDDHGGEREVRIEPR